MTRAQSLVLKAIFLGTVFVASCLSSSQRGKFCYTWGDVQGMAHVTCKATKPDCDKDKAKKEELYQTLSTCEKR